jgi:hypothetical protein
MIFVARSGRGPADHDPPPAKGYPSVGQPIPTGPPRTVGCPDVRHRLNENDETTLLPATVEELAAGERDEAEEAAGPRRRPVVLAAVATSVLMLGTAGWVISGRSGSGDPTADPTPSRSGSGYVDGFGIATASPRAEGPPISRGSARPPVSPSPSPAVSSTQPSQPPQSPSPEPKPVAAPQSTLLSRGRPAAASGSESNDRLGPSRAVDGDINTRWGSPFSEPHWIRVDLGASRRITRVQLRWETAFGVRYEVQVSADGSLWRTVSTVTSGNGGIDDLEIRGTDSASSGRYVRIFCTQRGTEWGFSLWELDVYGY